MPLLISLAILVVGGPVLALPDLLPDAWRTGATIVLSVAALLSATWTMQAVEPLRWPVGIFAGALVLNALLHLDAPMVSLRHTSGATLGLLAMAVIGTGAQTESRLRVAGSLVGIGGLVLMLGGLGSTYFGWDGQKLVLGSTSEQQQLLYPWLPQTQLPLPGLEREEGWVNANALGGTALMVLPLLVGLACAAARLTGWGRVAGLCLAVPGTFLALSALWMSRSRTALLGAVILAVILAVRWKAARRAIVTLVLLGVVVVGVSLSQRRQSAPGLFNAGITSTISNLETRASYWQLAVATIARHPVLGVGVSQFHEGPADAIGQRPYIAHAHNIFLQVALDVGLLGLAGYLWLFGWCVSRGWRATPTAAGALAAGATLSLVAVHLFGLTDAIALGAKVGLFQWLCAGIVIAEWSSRSSLLSSQQ